MLGLATAGNRHIVSAPNASIISKSRPCLSCGCHSSILVKRSVTSTGIPTSRVSTLSFRKNSPVFGGRLSVKASVSDNKEDLPVDDVPAARKSGALYTLLHPFSDPVVNGRLLSLCVASALCSVATLIHDTYLPIYLSEQLGLSNTKIGNLQAIAQFLCNASKSVSGTLADILSPAKMVIFGTLLTTLNKPMFALSGSIYTAFGTMATLYWITAGKVFDRMSKGIREAPGKALIGDLASESGDKPDGAFGLRQAMSTFGALIGATVAGLTFKLSGQNYIMTFALSALPAAGALLLTVSAFGSKAAQKSDLPIKKGKKDEVQLTLYEKAKALGGALPAAYWQALIVVGILYFARFDPSFITLRAKTIIPRAQLPLLTSIIMVTQAVFSAPAGIRAQGSIRARNTVLILGYACMIAADLSFALWKSPAGIFMGSFWVGLHMALTHGVTLAMMASYIPTKEVPGIGRISGTAWSLTDFIFGVILAYSNSLAGRLTDLSMQRGYGNIGCFFGGTLATALSGIALLIFSKFSDLGREDKIVTLKKSKK